MKKLFVIISLLSLLCTCGCSYNPIARQFGGTLTIDLAENRKLINVGWKANDSLWILTRPMRDDEEAEEYTYKEDATFGILEGTVIIKERKSKK